MPPAVHGGSHEGLLDFSTGVSPLPVPEQLGAAIRAADLSRYPHPTALPVRRAVAALHDLSPDQVVVGAGSVELIWALTRAFAGPGRAGMVVAPAFGEYEQALRASGADVHFVTMAGPAFCFSRAAAAAALAAAPVSLVFVCRPSNPCLTAAAVDDLLQLARRFPETLFAVDEAYLPLFEGIDQMPWRANVAVLRSMTKVFALPGVRLGYLVAAPPIAAAVQAALPPWNVSAPAQAAGVAAADLLPTHAPAIRERIAHLRASLRSQLAPIAGVPVQQGGPFLLYEVDQAAGLVSRLRERGVAIRHATSFGLPNHIRIGVRDQPAHQVLVERWREFNATVAPNG